MLFDTEDSKISWMITGAQNVFFEAMLDGGYASKRKKPHIVVDQLCNTKLVIYKTNSWRVLDYWCVSEDWYSKGNTEIWHENTLVWTMNYWGIYPELVVPVLKLALRKNYEAGIWSGGRGPEIFGHRDYIYKNVVEKPAFSDGHGRECIVKAETNQELGWHKYVSYALVSPVQPRNRREIL